MSKTPTNKEQSVALRAQPFTEQIKLRTAILEFDRAQHDWWLKWPDADGTLWCRRMSINGTAKDDLLKALRAHLAPASPAVPTSEPLREWEGMSEIAKKWSIKHTVENHEWEAANRIGIEWKGTVWYMQQAIDEALSAHPIPQAAPTAEAVANEIAETAVVNLGEEQDPYLGLDVPKATAIIQRALASAHLAAGPVVEYERPINAINRLKRFAMGFAEPVNKWDVEALLNYIGYFEANLSSLTAPAQPDTVAGNRVRMLREVLEDALPIICGADKPEVAARIENILKASATTAPTQPDTLIREALEKAGVKPNPFDCGSAAWHRETMKQDDAVRKLFRSFAAAPGKREGA